MRSVGPRLGPMVTVSALVHVVALGYTLATFRPQPRVVFRPAYTVDLVDAPRAGTVAPAPPAPAPTPPPAATPAPAVARATPPPPPPPAPRETPPVTPARSDMAELERQREEAERKRVEEAERKRAEEAEKARLAELERQRQAELEAQRRAELERQRQAEVEKQRQAELERQRQAELERQARLAQLQEQRDRIREEEARRQAEAERQARIARLDQQRAQIRETAARAAAARAAEEALKVKFQAYYEHAHQAIQGLWIVPEWVRRRDVEVRVSLTVARDGRILSTSIEKRSGYPDLDESVLRAVEKAKQAGLPPLPPEYTQDRLEFGLIFNPSKS